MISQRKSTGTFISFEEWGWYNMIGQFWQMNEWQSKEFQNDNHSVPMSKMFLS